MLNKITYNDVYDATYADRCLDSMLNPCIDLTSLAKYTALDYGCGTGLLTMKLEHYCEHVDGYDIDKSIAEKFRFNTKKARLIDENSFEPNKYDVVFSLFNVINYMDEKILVDFFSNMQWLAKNDAKLVLDFISRDRIKEDYSVKTNECYVNGEKYYLQNSVRLIDKSYARFSEWIKKDGNLLYSKVRLLRLWTRHDFERLANMMNYNAEFVCSGKLNYLVVLTK